ncbi:hypothetical protein B0H11DRAFT_1916473 [Mycena galericulata]|nr:hypothetical protein B0H11DRAFT_1916473 [Mycena galericulata]
MAVPFCASTACSFAQGVQKANTSHFSPSSPPSWSKAGVWFERESGKHGSNCTFISDFEPHRPTLASLPTLHPALHPRGRKRECGSKERVGSMAPTAPPFRICVNTSSCTSLPTLHPALHPRGRKPESGSKERVGSMAPTAPSFRISSLPTLHPALHPRGRKRESGSRERVGSMASTALSFRICMSTPPRAHPFPLSTQLSTLVVESGSLGRKREWEAWLQLHHHFGFWTPHAVNIVSIPLEAQCVPRWVDMAGKLPAPLSECRVHPVRGPRPSVCLKGSTWRGNFPLHSVNVVSIPLEAQCVPRWVDMAGKLPAPLSECRVHPIRGPTWRGNFPLHSLNVVSIPLEAQCVPRWVDMAGTFLTVPMNAVSIPLEFQCVPRWESGPVSPASSGIFVGNC